VTAMRRAFIHVLGEIPVSFWAISTSTIVLVAISRAFC